MPSFLVYLLQILIIKISHFGLKQIVPRRDKQEITYQIGVHVCFEKQTRTLRLSQHGGF